MAERRWRAADILRLGIGEGQQLVYARPSRTAQVLERPQAALLANCQTFRTIEEHARAAANNPPPAAATDPRTTLWNRLFTKRKVQLELNRVAAIRAQLETFARDGLLVEEASLQARCLAAPQRDAGPVSISTVSVVTADRVASLQRCVSSYLDNARSHQRTIRVQVMDDARTAGARTATQQMLGELARERGANIVYAGTDQKRELAGALSAAGEIPPEVIDFALFDPEGCGRSTGANHNAQLLYACGEAILSIDDDTTARLGPVPGAEAGLTLSSEYQTPPTRFFPDRAGALTALSFEDRDAVAIHEELLGRRVGTCVNELGRSGPLLVDRLGTVLLRGIEQGRAQVLATQTGLVGDTGTPNPPPLTRPAGESWARLVASESVYREAMRSREVVRGRSRLTITDNPFLSTGPVVGFDNRELLPAFFPVLRNTDGIFGLTLRATIEGSCIAHLPWALEHLPAEPRSMPGDALTRIASRCAVHEIITAAIHSFPIVAGAGGDGAGRITALGRHLHAVGSLENHAFLEFVRPWIWRTKSVAIAALEEDLAEHNDQPSYWAADVRSYIQTLREALATDAYFVPDDLPSTFSDDERIQLTGRLVRRFGELLEWWPAIIERARVLHAEGRTFLLRL